MPPHASLARNFLSLFTGQVITWSFAAIMLIVLPRYLGAEGAGVVSIGATYAAIILTISGLGLTTAITKEVAKAPEGVASWLGLSLVLQAGAGLVLAVVATGLAFVSGSSTQVVFAVAISCCTAPIILISLTTNAVLQGLERMTWTAIYDVASKGLTLAFVLGVILAGGSIYAVLLALNLGGLLVATGQLVHIRRLVVLRLMHPSRDRLLGIFRGGAPYLLIAVLWAIYTSADVILMSVLTTEGDAGIYAAPMRLFGTALFIPATLATVVFPRLVSTAQSDGSSFRLLSGLSLLVAGTASGGMTLAAALTSDDALVTLLGSEFERSGPVILILCASLVPTALNTVAAKIAFANNRQSSIAAIGAGAVIIKVAMGIVLIPFFDRTSGNAAVGAAVSLVAVEWLMLVAMLTCVPREIWSPVIVRRFAGLALALVCGVATLLSVASASTAWLAGTAGVMVYVALLALLGTHPIRETGDYLRNALPRGLIPSKTSRS